MGSGTQPFPDFAPFLPTQGLPVDDFPQALGSGTLALSFYKKFLLHLGLDSLCHQIDFNFLALPRHVSPNIIPDF